MRGNAGHLTALASLRGVGPSRLRLLLATWEPAEAWARVCAGTATRDPALAAALGTKARELTAAWRTQAATLDPESIARRSDELGLRLLTADDDAFPDVLRLDPEPPVLLWALGDLDAMDGPSVGVVGTRNCTRYGHDVARRTGRGLAESGIAGHLGTRAGHRRRGPPGVLEATSPGAAPPIGIVGSGLDIVYPSRNRGLWHEVAGSGVLLSEAPPGAPPEPWRFPARNRLIAALSAAIVVVESSERGGSLLTVDEAVARDVEVLSVPGPITSQASTGTNRLIAEGATPYLEVDDVLDVVGAERPAAVAGTETVDAVALTRDEAVLLDALSAGPATLADLAEAVSVPFGQLSLVATQLEATGRVTPIRRLVRSFSVALPHGQRRVAVLRVPRVAHLARAGHRPGLSCRSGRIPRLGRAFGHPRTVGGRSTGAAALPGKPHHARLSVQLDLPQGHHAAAVLPLARTGRRDRLRPDRRPVGTERPPPSAQGPLRDRDRSSAHPAAVRRPGRPGHGRRHAA